MGIKLMAEKAIYIKRGKAILKDLETHPEKMEKLEEILRKNDFGDIADLAVELKEKYL
ncbi:MAG: hypothetical protein J6Y02_08895 [Pseudobutyrivibrio sp.]|nr:hypothetical protein [Pseudobutyrivibrio sp.]